MIDPNAIDWSQTAVNGGLISAGVMAIRWLATSLIAAHRSIVELLTGVIRQNSEVLQKVHDRMTHEK